MLSETFGHIELSVPGTSKFHIWRNYFYNILAPIGCITENLPMPPNNSSLRGYQRSADFHLPIPCFFCWKSIIISSFPRGFRVFSAVDSLYAQTSRSQDRLSKITMHHITTPVFVQRNRSHKYRCYLCSSFLYFYFFTDLRFMVSIPAIAASERRSRIPYPITFVWSPVAADVTVPAVLEAPAAATAVSLFPDLEL